jgi:hypothetical protein
MMSVSPILEHGLVDLLLPGAERRAARVKAIGHGHVLLTLFGEPVGSAVGPDATAATLEVVGEAGVARVTGRVAHGGDPRALTFEPADPGVLPQRRSAPRVSLDRELLLERRPGGSATGRVVDVSEGGVRFRSAGGFELEQPVEVTFAPDGDGRPLRGTGRVLRIDGEGLYAVEFARWPQAARRRLRRLIESGAALP